MRRQSSVTITSGRLDGRGVHGCREISLAFNAGGREPGMGSDVTRPAYVVVVVCGRRRLAVSRRRLLVNQSLSSTSQAH